MPGISSSGKSRPQSTAMTSSPDSRSIMLSPISPSPPRGIRRSAGSEGTSIGTGSGRYTVLTAADSSYHPGWRPPSILYPAQADPPHHQEGAQMSRLEGLALALLRAVVAFIFF